MKTIGRLVLLVVIGLAAPAEAVGPVVATCRLAWEAPTTNANGTPLADLAGYDVQLGGAPGTFPDPPFTLAAGSPSPAANTTVTWTCPASITDGQKYARVRPFDLAGNRGAWSPEVPFVYDATAPGPVLNLRVQ